MKDTKTKLIIVFIGLTVISLILTGQSSAKIDPKTAIGIWLFDEGSGDTAKDTSGNKNDGTLINNPKWVAGKFGTALEFPKGSVVSIPHNSSMNLTKWTLAALVKVKGITGAWQVIAGKYDMAQAVNYATYAAQGTGLFAAQFSGGANWYMSTGTTIITNDQWHYVVGTYDMIAMRAYVDGILEAEAIATDKPNTSSAPITIGAWSDGNTFPIDGTIDEVSLFNEVLAIEDIEAIMKNGISKELNPAAVSAVGKLATAWAVIKAH
jgi:hypothetical protein